MHVFCGTQAEQPSDGPQYECAKVISLSHVFIYDHLLFHAVALDVLLRYTRSMGSTCPKSHRAIDSPVADVVVVRCAVNSRPSPRVD